MRKLWLILLTPVLMLLMPGCHRSNSAEPVTGLTFERGSGSVWGDQLYISLTQERITTLRYIPEGSGELEILEDLPITQDQWQAIIQELEKLPLEREKPNLLEKLFGKQDGTDFRRLTVTRGTETVTYRWPEKGEALELLLEQLVGEVTG